jgi:hypothetical protein
MIGDAVITGDLRENATADLMQVFAPQPPPVSGA